MKNRVIEKKLNKYNNLSSDLEEKYKFYLIDLEIKEILFKYLERLEDSLKAQLLKNIGDDFLSEENFLEKFLEKRRKFNEEKIRELKKRYKKIDEKIFFMELTFGELVRYFKDLKKEYKEKIIGFYGFRKFSIFESWFFSIRYLRNLVCHGENIFNRKFGEKPLGKKLYKIFNIKENDFILYIAIIEIFGIVLNIDNKLLFVKIKKILEKQKNLPVGGQISKIEIEAWQVFIQKLYSSFIKNQEKKELFIKKQKNMKKTILITGGTGYIGSHGVVAFEQAGYKTVIVDNLVNSSLESLDGIEKILGYKPDFYNVDLRDKEKLKDIFKKYNFDGVIHFAGLKAVGESCEKPLEYFDNNIVGTIKLFELMEKYKVKNIVFSSSATVYKPESISPLFETTDIGNTSNPYGTTKFITEQILRDLAKFSGFRVMNLRYFNPIGAHESGFIGEDPEGIPNNLLPYIMKVATGELEKLKVFGDDYATNDGTGVRDYIDVVDLIEGHLKAYEKISESEKGFFEVYNLGVGRGISVLEMVNVAKKVTKKEIHYEIVDRRSGDLAEVYCNPEKAKNELNWEAKTSLEDSLKNSWKFYNK